MSASHGTSSWQGPRLGDGGRKISSQTAREMLMGATVNGSTLSLLRRFALSVSILCLLLPAARLVGQAPPKPRGSPAAPGAPAAPAAAAPKAEEPKAPAKPDPEAELAELFKKEESVTNTLGMVMVWVPKGFRVGQLEVTQEQFEK